MIFCAMAGRCTALLFFAPKLSVERGTAAGAGADPPAVLCLAACTQPTAAAALLNLAIAEAWDIEGRSTGA